MTELFGRRGTEFEEKEKQRLSGAFVRRGGARFIFSAQVYVLRLCGKI